MIFLKAVAVTVAIVVDPRQASFRSFEMTLQKGPVPGRPPGGVQSDQAERRGVRGAVIGRVRDQLEMGQFAVAYFMQDFARLGIAVVVRSLAWREPSISSAPRANSG